jgi:hypothetical protein
MKNKNEDTRAKVIESNALFAINAIGILISKNSNPIAKIKSCPSL